jgi:CheY-like chemotaxis protein
MDVAQFHILVVDDYVDAADSTVELLSMWGYDAIARCTCATALESASFHRPDVVVLELAMPHMNGFHFTGLFRELSECGSIPIIVVSGYFSQAYQSSARAAGIHHYLLKPAEPALLKDLLAREIESQVSSLSLYRDTPNRIEAKTPRSKNANSLRVFQQYSAPRARG